ncbi:MAG: hypothetical protein ABEH77_02650, partial [Halobacteriaceae archaeon]
QSRASVPVARIKTAGVTDSPTPSGLPPLDREGRLRRRGRTPSVGGPTEAFGVFEIEVVARERERL